MPTNADILILASNTDEVAELGALLAQAGLKVSVTALAQALDTPAKLARPLVTVLNTNLPFPNTAQTLERLQKHSEYGVIILCPVADTTSCILGLEMGADDVIEQHRDPREIVARITRLISRAEKLTQNLDGQQEVSFSDWWLSIERRELRHNNGKIVHLTRGEFELLAALAGHKGKVMTRDQLLDHISHREWAPNDRTIDVLVNRLRQKIDEPPREPRHLITVHGVGYVFNA